MISLNVFRTLLALPIILGLYCVAKVETTASQLKKANPDAIIMKSYVPFAELLMRAKIWKFMNWATNPREFIYKKDHDQVVFMIFPDRKTMIIAEPDLINQVFTRKQEFIKPIEVYGFLNIFGSNIVTTNGTEWKRHRKVTAPYFGENSNENVFKCTTLIIDEMCADWESKGLDTPKDISMSMYEVALTVVSGVAFGKQLPWKEPPAKAGDNQSFKSITSDMINSWIKGALTPDFMYKLPIKSLEESRSHLEKFDSAMRGFIQDSLTDQTNRDKNMLASLVSSISTEATESTLTEREVIGNMFIFMFAGHETTAGTLSFAFSLLALNTKVQERLYDEIITVCGSDAFEYSHLQKMPFTLAVFNETLRMNPPVAMVIKKAMADYKLGKYTVPKDFGIYMHAFGVQFSEKYWGNDRLEFNPARWFCDPECGKSAKKTKEAADEHSLKSFLHINRYSFITFSDGPRACLGRRFAEVEAMTVLVKLILKFKVKVPENVSENELLKGNTLITFKQVNNAMLLFSKREKLSE
jgi:cytochrome P450